MIVVAGGGRRVSADGVRPRRSGAVVAADGASTALTLSALHVDVASGDFDSVSPAGLAAAEAAGARVVRHPAEKDATDLELALDEAARARSRGGSLVVGVAGGRLDHLLAGCSLARLGAATRTSSSTRSRARRSSHVVRGERELEGDARRARLAARRSTAPPRASSPKASLIRSRGETLVPGSSRGVSNVFAATRARVRVERGVLLAPPRYSVSDRTGSSGTG